MVHIVEKLAVVLKTKFISNTGWIVGERIYQMIINLVLTMIIARHLGPQNFGILNYTASFAAFFAPVCGLGLEGVIVKELVDDPKNEGILLGSSIIMRLVSSVMSMIAILAIILFLNPNDTLMLSVATLQSIALIFSSVQIIEFWYQSKLQSKYSSIIKSITYTSMAIYKLMIVVLSKSIQWFAFSTTIDAFLIAILFLYFYKKSGGLKLLFSFDAAKKLFMQSYHFVLSGLIVAIYSQMDKVMIGQFLAPKEVGFYSAAITICGLWTFVPQAFISSATPIIISLRNKNAELYLRRLKQLYAFITWLGVAFALMITLFSKLIVLILYGEAYLAAIPSLVIAVWYTVFSSLGDARGIWILCEKKNRYVKKYLFWGTAVNLVLNTLMIPRYGIEGAAIATLVTQIVTCIIAPSFYKETRVHIKYVLEAIAFKGII